MPGPPGRRSPGARLPPGATPSGVARSSRPTGPPGSARPPKTAANPPPTPLPSRSAAPAPSRAPRDIRLQIARDLVVELARRPRLLVQDLVQQHPRVAAEGQLARQQLVQHHAQAVHVGSAIRPVALAARLLRRHVGRVPSTCPSTVIVASAASRLANSKSSGTPSLLVEHHVGRLDVAVVDAAVRGRSAVPRRWWRTVPAAFTEWWSPCRQQVGERDADEEIGDEVGGPGRAGRPRRSAGSTGAAGGRRCAAWRGTRSWLTADSLNLWRARGDLEGDDAVELRVVGLVDHAEAARADLGEHLETADGAAGPPLKAPVEPAGPAGKAEPQAGQVTSPAARASVRVMAFRHCGQIRCIGRLRDEDRPEKG